MLYVAITCTYEIEQAAPKGLRCRIDFRRMFAVFAVVAVD